jgi:hypothetical protein
MAEKNVGRPASRKLRLSRKLKETWLKVSENYNGNMGWQL